MSTGNLWAINPNLRGGWSRYICVQDLRLSLGLTRSPCLWEVVCDASLLCSNLESAQLCVCAPSLARSVFGWVKGSLTSRTGLTLTLALGGDPVRDASLLCSNLESVQLGVCAPSLARSV